MSEGQPKKKGLRVTVEVARSQLMEDPETQQLAETFGVTLEEYVEMVLDYAKNPDKEPVLQVATDEEIAESGADAPTVDDVKRWFAQVESGEIELGPQRADRDGFTTAKEQEKSKQIAGLEAKLAAPKIGEAQRQVVVPKDNPLGSALKDQLMQQRSRAQVQGAATKKAKRKKSPTDKA